MKEGAHAHGSPGRNEEVALHGPIVHAEGDGIEDEKDDAVIDDGCPQPMIGPALV